MPSLNIKTGYELLIKNIIYEAGGGGGAYSKKYVLKGAFKERGDLME